MPSTPWTVGYCTNVHAGTDLASIQENLLVHAAAVRDQVAGQGTLGVGLWIPAEAAEQLTAPDSLDRFSRFLQENRFDPFTMNGFPYGNFHQKVVKHRVYDPAWWDPRRRDYTLSLVEILHRLLPAGRVGSISTLPLGWGKPEADDPRWGQSQKHLREVAEHLERLESETGRRIVIAIEPEPGCVLDRSDEVVDFFERHLSEANLRRYLTVCHDICHTAVMFEDQEAVLQKYAAAGIGVGKVQVSSAVEVVWEGMSGAERAEALEQLSGFAEDRYLHQTGRQGVDGTFAFSEDLPDLLRSVGPPLAAEAPPAERAWRVHFHVPIFLERFGRLQTTSDQIASCLAALHSQGSASPEFTGHVEVETYAWGVLPAAMRRSALADDIASELQWLDRQLQALSTRAT